MNFNKIDNISIFYFDTVSKKIYKISVFSLKWSISTRYIVQKFPKPRVLTFNYLNLFYNVGNEFLELIFIVRELYVMMLTCQINIQISIEILFAKTNYFFLICT